MWLSVFVWKLTLRNDYFPYICSMFLKVLILSVIMLGIAFIGLAFRILFVREGRFPETSVGKNKELRERGLNCARHEEMSCRKVHGEYGGCGC